MLHDQQDQKVVVLFDGECKLCNGAVQFIIKHEKEPLLFFASLQSSYGQEFLKRHKLPSESFKTMILFDGTTYYTQSEAALKVASYLKPPYRLLQYLTVIPTKWRDHLYEIISENRYRWFGKRDHCMIPTKNLKARFIS